MDLGLLRIELLVGALLGLIFVVDLFIGKKAVLKYLALAGTLGILVYSFFFRELGTTFFGAYISDGLSLFFKILFLLSTSLVIIFSFNFFQKNKHYIGEYLVLLLSATLGMMLMASSLDLLMFYVSLELLSLSSYVLSALQKSSQKSTEAGIKYLLLGAMASGVLLFGISLIYGITGTINYAAISASIAANSSPLILHIGVIMVLAALCFKIAVIPFHMWVPDVYEGAPSPIVAFFSVGTKIAGFAVLLRLFLTAFGGLSQEWGILMAVLSAVTIIIGNLLAIPQTNIKRFMGYSSIAQAGYILMGVAVASLSGVSATLFYLLAYLFSNLCAFAVITIFSEKLGKDNIDDYRGLYQRSPFMAFVLLLALMSLGGVPPLAGFIGKLYLFFAAAEKGLLWLVAIGVLMSVVSIYYYLMILKRAYIDKAEDMSVIKLTGWEKFSLSLCAAGTVLVGFIPGPIFNHILAISQSFLSGVKLP